jgi:hypothetical protein
MEAKLIYTRYSPEPITITAARIIPVWMVRRPGKLVRLYAKPGVIRVKGKFVECRAEEIPVWHFKGQYKDGTLHCDGKWVDTSSLIADKGWTEIDEVLKKLNPKDRDAYYDWNKSDQPIENFFNPVDEKDVA